MPRVLFGIDHFTDETDKLRGLRLALVTNNAATTSRGILNRVALLKKGIKLVKLFSPEHGLTAAGEDGAFQANTTDTTTNLPVLSLYGDKLKPSGEDLHNVDAVVFDIPDVGCRFYTYLWTMTYIMEACAEVGKPLFILDRPNPISGDLDLSEGPMLDEVNCSSFIGRWSIPLRHSCTLGELARYFAATKVKDLDLTISTVKNWSRHHRVTESKWFFVPPSPAILDAETALLYPGMGLMEGINVNEGRGTNNPFKIFGTPWINAYEVHEAFKNLKLPGVSANPCSYEPRSGLYRNEKCNGLKLRIEDPASFRSAHMGFTLIKMIASLYPEFCAERMYATRANPSGHGHLDKLSGIYHSFEKIKNMKPADAGYDALTWKETISPYLLY